MVKTMIELQVWRPSIPVDGLPGGGATVFVSGKDGCKSISYHDGLVMIDINSGLLVMSVTSGAGSMTKGTYEQLKNEKRQSPAASAGTGQSKRGGNTSSVGKARKSTNSVSAGSK